MKFRCERDDPRRGPRHRWARRGRPRHVAPRAVGASALELTGRRASPSPAPTSSSRSPSRSPSRAAATASSSSRAASRRHRPRRSPPAASRSRSATTRPASPPAAPSSALRSSARRVPPASPSPAGEPVTLASAELATALSQVVRAASSDDARPILTGVLLAAEADGPAPGGHRLLPPRHPRPARHDGARPRARRCSVPSRALTELARVLARRRRHRSPCASASATPASRSAAPASTTCSIEGEFPPYERPDPHGAARTRSRWAARCCSRPCGGSSSSPARPPRCAWRMSSDGLELVAITQDVGQAHEALDAKFEGTDLTVAFNPEYLVQGIEVAPGDEVTIETVDAPQARPAPLLRAPGLPLPADARPGLLIAPCASTGSGWTGPAVATRPPRSSCSPGPHRPAGDNGQGRDRTCSRPSPGWPRWARSRAPTEALIRRGADRAVIRAEGEREGRAILLEAELVASGRNRVLVNRQPLQEGPGPPRACCGSASFSPDDLELIKGGPAERRRYLDEALVASHPATTPCGGEVDKVLKQRNALLKGVRRPARRERRVARSTCADAKLVESGGRRWPTARRNLLDRLVPVLADSLRRRRPRPRRRGARRVRWPTGPRLGLAEGAGRRPQGRPAPRRVHRRPHRDDVDLRIGGMPARTHASQGSSARSPWPCAWPPTT